VRLQPGRGFEPAAAGRVCRAWLAGPPPPGGAPKKKSPGGTGPSGACGALRAADLPGPGPGGNGINLKGSSPYLLGLPTGKTAARRCLQSFRNEGDTLYVWDGKRLVTWINCSAIQGPAGPAGAAGLRTDWTWRVVWPSVGPAGAAGQPGHPRACRVPGAAGSAGSRGIGLVCGTGPRCSNCGLDPVICNLDTLHWRGVQLGCCPSGVRWARSSLIGSSYQGGFINGGLISQERQRRGPTACADHCAKRRRG